MSATQEEGAKKKRATLPCSLCSSRDDDPHVHNGDGTCPKCECGHSRQRCPCGERHEDMEARHQGRRLDARVRGGDTLIKDSLLITGAMFAVAVAIAALLALFWPAGALALIRLTFHW